MDEEQIEHLRKQLAIHQSNLNALRQKAAMYGFLEVPLEITSQIALEEKAIRDLEQQLLKARAETLIAGRWLLGGVGLVVIVLVVGVLVITGIFGGPRPTSTPAVAVLSTETPTEVPVVLTPTQAPAATPRPMGTLTPTPELTNTPLPRATPTPFGGGGSIAYACSYASAWEICLTDLDGTGITKLNQQGGDPALSPDGRWVIFGSDRTGDGEIYRVGVDGMGLQNLSNAAGEDGWPAWSPDGMMLAFASRRTGNAELYVMNTDGTGLRRLTTNPANDLCPTWSPNGQTIAFSSNRSGTWEIWIVPADGEGTPTGLTDTGDPDGQGWPAWSPDGNSIAFECTSGNDREVCVLNPDGSVTYLTDNTAYDGAPAWSPDGRMIAFVSDRDGDLALYVMNADGGGLTRLIQDGSWQWGPSWSPGP